MTAPADPLDRGRDLAHKLRRDDEGRVAEVVEELCDEIARVRRQVTRFGLDLHDDALQDITALRNDLQLFRRQIATVLEAAGERRRVVGRVDDFLARVLSLEAVLRDLATAAPAAVLREPLSVTLGAVVEAQSGPCLVEASLDPNLDECELTDSQRIVIVRIVQSALANVVQHSWAERASVAVRCLPEVVECEIVDDGRGFDVEASLGDTGAARRIGLRGMRERVLMLGGMFEATSRPGKTRIYVRLPLQDLASRRSGPRSSGV